MSDSGPRARGGFILAPFGAAIGFVASACGIGGGLFAVPWLHERRGFDLKRAVATSLCLVVATSFAATVTEALHADSRLDGALIAATALGALIGAQLGFALVQRIPARILKSGFVLVFAVAGARLLFASDVGASADGAPLSWLALYGGAALVGLGGGFLSPLLGVGGGLLIVPGLLFVLPALEFPGARATSLAVATIVGPRALYLHARAGRVEARTGATLAAGALVGAFAGVMIAHFGSIADLGRRLLGAILVVVALRFAAELRRRQA